MNAAAKKKSAAAAEKKANAGQFKAGVGFDVSTQKPAVAVEGDGLLGAMRHVMANQNKRHDRTMIQKTTRRWALESPKDFLLRYNELEKEADRLNKPVGQADPGTETALRLLDKLLAGFSHDQPGSVAQVGPA